MNFKSLSLIIAPDTRLKLPTQDIKEITPKETQLIKDLFIKLSEHNAIGLTAAHFGISQSIVVIHIDKPIVLINPKMIYTSDSCNISQESSVSFPGISVKISRHQQITVEYLDEAWSKQKLKAENLLSYCLQHELDQLQGVTILDRVSRLQRDFLLNKMQKYKNMLSLR